MDAEAEGSTARTVRRLLLVTLVIGMIGTLCDLLLIEHHEDRVQFVPLGLLGAGLLILLLHAFLPGRKTIRALQVAMVCYAISGLVGVYFHVRGNNEFALEMGREGSELFWDSIIGVPPVLAPGAMIYIGLLGFAYTWRHPRLG